MANKKETSTPGPTKHTAVLLSAGAPHSPLMAGFLCAVYEKGKAFEFIYTSGAGALIGLLYVAPKGKKPDQALRDIVELAVADPIYRLCPINYKVFFKPGPFTRPMRRLAEAFKLGESPLRPLPAPASDFGKVYNQVLDVLGPIGPWRLYNDLVDFCAAALTPTTLNYWSKGLCEPLPFLEELVSFDKLSKFTGHFYLNAFNVTDRTMETFGHPQITITPAHVRAALAHPFIYRPVRIDGKVYSEGADRKPINFAKLSDMDAEWKNRGEKDIGTIVLLDILGALNNALLRSPNNLWEAFAMSILQSVIGLAKQEVKYFKKVTNARGKYNLKEIAFEIPEEFCPHITEWTYSNLNAMWDIGHSAGVKFVDTPEGQNLPDRQD
jgi:NTE family protein